MHSLALKMTLRIWGAATLVLLAIIGLEYSLDKREVVGEIQERMWTVAQGLAKTVDARFARAAQLPSLLSSYLETHSALSEEELGRYMRQLLRKHPEIFGTCAAFAPHGFSADRRLFAPYYYRKEGRIAHRELGDSGYDYLNRPWYRVTAETRTARWTDQYFDEGGGDALMLTHAVPFRRNGAFAGVATVDVSLSTLSREVSEVKVGRSGYGFLADTEGTLVAFPDRSRLAKSLADTSPQLARALASAEPGRIEVVDPLRGKPAWVVHHPIANTRLELAVVYPKHEAMMRVLALNRGTLIVAIVGLLGLLVVVALVSRSVARPVSGLAAAARVVAKGDLELQLPAPRTRDEVGVLSSAFSKMVADLRTHIAELQQSTAERERMSSELRIAHEIQLSILPRSFPPFPHDDRFAIYACAHPAREMGGDFYDFFLVDEARLGFVIADVSDKGVPAALYMAVSRTLVRATARQRLPVGECLAQVNDLLAAENETCMFVTLFYGILDAEQGQVEFANAGHNPPFHLSSGGVLPLSGDSGVALGIQPGALYPTNRAELQPGDALFLFTDGITEATDARDDLFGEARLAAALVETDRSSPERTILDVLDRVREHTAEAPQLDDITALAVAFFGPQGAEAHRRRAFDAVLRNNLDEIARIQHLVEEHARAHGLDDKAVNALNVALDEVLTNVISYGFEDDGEHAIPVRVDFTAGRVEIEVRDDGRPFNPLETPPPDTDASVEERPIGGLGIHLVLELMDEVAYRRERDHNVLTLRLQTRK